MKGYLDLVVHDGNRPLMEALEASVVSLLAGRPLHVHVEGLRGTGKTTIIRAMRDVLPTIRRIRGCPYNCDPGHPHCPEHRGLTREAVASLGAEDVPVPFLEISHAAKIGTVVGSIDLARIADPSRPEAALLPGVLPRAHRGVVFVDEINRLADTSPELTDVLLDVMGTKPGRLQVEETGLPTFEIPMTCAVWAASNPDEEPGALEDIRRQLSDRFDFTVNMARPQDQSTVKRILLDGDPESVWQPTVAAKHATSGGRPCAGDLQALRDRMLGRASALSSVALPDDLASLLAEMYVSFGMESLRAVEAVSLGARVRAALHGRPHASIEDVKSVLPFALRHRVDASTLINIGKFFDEYESRCGKRREADAPRDETAAGTQNDPAEDGRQKDRDLATGAGEHASRPDTLWERLMRGMGFARPDIGRPGPANGDRAGSGAASPRTSPPGTSSAGGGSADYAGGGSAGYPSGGDAVMDPTDVPLTAPPAKARCLAQLAGGEVVFTEEDLRFR